MRTRLLLLPLSIVALACSAESATSINGGPGGNPGGNGGDTSVSAVGFVVKSVVVDGVSYKYSVFVPANYNASTAKIPVIVFMHGGQQGGLDGLPLQQEGLGRVVREQESTFSSIAIFPQSPSGESQWLIFDKIVMAALDQVMSQYGKSDPTRVYLTGWSYGAVHGFDLVYQNPTRFAAFVPIATYIYGPSVTGSSSTTAAEAALLFAQKLKTFPVWQFHGALDLTVKPAVLKPLVDILKSTATNYQYTEFVDGDHQISERVYRTPSFWTWLYAQHR